MRGHVTYRRNTLLPRIGISHSHELMDCEVVASPWALPMDALVTMREVILFCVPLIRPSR